MHIQALNKTLNHCKESILLFNFCVINLKEKYHKNILNCHSKDKSYSSFVHKNCQLDY